MYNIKAEGSFSVKHFLFNFGFLLLASAFFGSFLKADILFVFGAIALITGIFLILLSEKYRHFGLLFVAVTLGFGLIAINLLTQFYPASALDKSTAEIRGTVTEVRSGSGNTRYTVETDYIGIEGAPQKIKLRLSSYEGSYIKEYDKISCEAEFAVYNGSTDEILSDRASEISIYAYAKTPITVVGEEHGGIGYFIFLIREKISSVIYEYFIDWHAPFMDELLIGNKGELDPSIKTAFRHSGLSHILAISGMHLSIILGILERFFHYKNAKIYSQKKVSVFLALVTGFYMLLCGLGVSVLRAGFMFIIRYITNIFSGNSDSVDNLGAAVCIIILLDPFACTDVGFLMSVTASAALIIFMPPFSKHFIEIFKAKDSKIGKFLIESFASGVIGSLSVLPICATVFGEISIIAPIANLFATLFAEYSLVFGLCATFFGLIPFLGFFAKGFAFLAMLCDGALLKIAEFCSELPFAYVKSESIWIFVWIIGTVLIMIFPVAMKGNFKYIRISALFSGGVLVLGFLLNYIFYSGVSKIEIVPLQSGAAFTCSVDGKSVLITKGYSASDKYNLSYMDYGTVVCVGSTSGFGETELLQNSEPETAFLSYEDVASRFENAEVLSLGKTEIPEIGYIEIISEGVFAIELNNATLLYVSENFDVMELEPKFRAADIMVFDGITPENFPALRCKQLIFTEQSGYFSGASEITVIDEEGITFFAYNKNIRKGWDFG